MSVEPLRALAFFGGGTGGHLTPGLAVAERAAERFPGCRAVFFRGGRPVEERVLAGTPYASQSLELAPPRGAAGWLRFARRAAAAVPRLRAALREGFDGAVGLGGYASFPGALAARREGIPVVLLEQNRVPGRVNRVLGPFVAAVCCADEDAARLLRGRCEVTGNPVRRAVREACERRLAMGPRGPGPRHVLVVGGSQGARGLNRALLAALEGLAPVWRDRIRWTHLAGSDDRSAVEAAYRRAGWSAEVLDWAADLPARLATAHLVVARAGGTTLAELAAIGVPAVLVPYPHHADRQQFLNARAFEAAGGARVVPEDALDTRALRRVLEEVLSADDRLEAMARGARSLGRPDAADRVLDVLLERNVPSGSPPRGREVLS